MTATTGRAIDVLCIGETMAVLSPLQGERIADARQLNLGIGGAESNVALHLVDQGVSASWASRLGMDQLGDRIAAELSSRGLDTSHVIRDPDAPTGVYFKERHRDGGTEVLYYRAGSAASRLSPADVSRLPLDRARWIHLSGITSAISASARAMLEALLDRAGELGVAISFDVNHRARLWRPETAAEVLLPIAQRADLVFVGRDEAETLWGTATSDDIVGLLDLPGLVVVKDGAVEAVEHDRRGIPRTTRVPTPPVEVVELVGAGDAFAAGYLAGLILGEGPEQRLMRGHHVASWTIGSWDDVRPGITPLPALIDSGPEPS